MLRTPFKPRGTMKSPYSTEILKQQSRLMFFFLPLLLCFHVKISMLQLQINFFFLFTITPHLCKNLAAHLSICRLNSGTISTSWKCFSCFHLAMQPFCRVATAFSLLWVRRNKDRNPLFTVFAILSVHCEVYVNYCYFLKPALEVRETHTCSPNPSIIQKH